MSRRRIALLCLLVLLAGVAWWRGWHLGVDEQQVGNWVRAAGAWGPILFVLLFAVGNGLGAPGFLFLLPAAALWPAWEAFALNWVGSIGAGLVGYFFARGIGRNFVERHLPRRLQGLDRHLASRAIRGVAALRITLFLAAPVHWALGLTSIAPRDLLIGSVIGFAPPVFFWTFASDQFFAAMLEGRANAWLAVGGFVLAALVLTVWLARRRTAAATE